MSKESEEITETIEDWDSLPLDPQPDVWEPVPLPENLPAKVTPDSASPRVRRGVEDEGPIDVWKRIRIDWRKVKNKWIRSR